MHDAGLPPGTASRRTRGLHRDQPGRITVQALSSLGETAAVAEVQAGLKVNITAGCASSSSVIASSCAVVVSRCGPPTVLSRTPLMTHAPRQQRGTQHTAQQQVCEHRLAASPVKAAIPPKYLQRGADAVLYGLVMQLL